MKLALTFFVLACGGKAPPARPVAHQAPAPAAATCADVGVILRGTIDTGDKEAGRAREAAIANACEIDRWSPSVIECVATEKKATTCLGKLTVEQRGKYDQKLTAWSDKYGGDSYGGDAYGGVAGSADDPPPPEVDCEEAVARAARFSPAASLTGDDGAWDEAMRQHAMEKLCDADAWDPSIRGCLDHEANVNNCLDVLPADARARITKRLGDIDGVAGKLADARKQPKKIGCDKVVAAHYADANWKDKVDWIKGKDRTKMIAESRDRMKKACVADKWNDTLRACVSVGGGEDCFAAAKVATWTFPAPGVTIPTGIAECDEWGKAIMQLSTCDKLPQASRDALVQAYAQLAQQITQMSKQQRADLAVNCKSGTDAIHQIGSMCP